ncbi:MAG: dihydroorotate dehydrogenase [Clostridiaceae bacterium]|nr:dihydroorotate dehydrogenase [Clostridiaceae bacterium]
MVDMTVQIGSLKLNNPVIAASGTFGFEREIEQYMDLSKLGGISSKGLTIKPRSGNDAPRVAECPQGMLNSVGLQNPGIEYFIENELPHMLTYGCAVIANIAGHEFEEYGEMAKLLEDTAVDAIELNLSCPNVSGGCMAFGSDAYMIRSVVSSVKKVSSKPLWVKLTPNVTSISEMAIAAEEAGADAVSLINTLLGLVIDIDSRRPIMKNNTGGLSGPAVRPVAVRMVNEVYNAVSIPVIGMGGIMTGRDAAEMMIAGASAVQVGTANLVKPTACIDIIRELESWTANTGAAGVSEITGTIVKW